MPFALIIVGIFLLVSAARSTQDDLFTLIRGDFTGPNNFFYWAISIMFIGAIGYVPKLRPLSTAFLVLVVIVLVLTKGNPNAPGGGFFQQFTSQLGLTQQSSSTKPGSTTPGTPASGSSNPLDAILNNLKQIPNPIVM